MNTDTFPSLAVLEARIAELEGHMRTMGVMLDCQSAGILRRDALLTNRDEQIKVLKSQLEGAYTANDSMFRERTNAHREVQELRAENRELRR